MKKNVAVLWLLRKIRHRFPELAIMTAAHMLHALLGVCFALGTRRIIDCAVAGERQQLLDACVWQLVLILGTVITLALYRHLKERLQTELDRDWKKELLHRLLHGEYQYVSGYHSGEILNRMNNDVRIVDDGILTIFPDLLAMATRLIAVASILTILDLRFMVLITVLGITVLLVTAFLRQHLKALHKMVAQYDGKVSGFLQEIMEKLLMVQAMDVSHEVERRADLLLNQRYQMQRKRRNIVLTANTGISILHYGGSCLALIWCAFRLLRGEITFGSLTAVTQLVGQLQIPIVGLSGMLPKYTAMCGSAERLMELESVGREPEVLEKNVQSLYNQLQAIGGESLYFAFDRTDVLQNASFTLPKGAFAVITGPSGIGKSTLLKLLLGIYRPESGELYLQCHDRISINRRTRGLFAYVPQGNLLLSGTLRENLTIGNPGATEDALRQAIYVSCMDTYVKQLPHGLDTVLGENNTGLSEGQAQRLSIARAVLTGAPILLLDECTSALDEQTEQEVLRRIRELPDRTCIAVTHRSAAHAVSDWKLEISDGKIYSEQI